MDGDWIGSIDISIKKAFTSRAFDISAKELAKNSLPGGLFFTSINPLITDRAK